MIASPCQTNVQQEFSELPQPTRATSSIRDNMTKICDGTFRFVFSKEFCPAQRAEVLNPLTRKIVFVRPASGVRPSVPHFLIVILQLFTSYLEIDEIVAFPIRSALQVCGPLLI